MKIVLFADRKCYEYVSNIFTGHPELGAEIVSFPRWKTADCFINGESPAAGEEEPEEASFPEDLAFDLILVATRHPSRRISRLLYYLHRKNVRCDVYVLHTLAVYTCADFVKDGGFDPYYVTKIGASEEKPYLPYLEILVCGSCNLKCKACSTFSPFVEGEDTADIVQLQKDLRNLSQLFAGILKIKLLGGEPLLEPGRCCEIVRTVREAFPDSELCVATNGTLIARMSSDFWDCLRENRVFLTVSVYPPFSGNMSDIASILQKNGIMYMTLETTHFSAILAKTPSEHPDLNNYKCLNCTYLQSGRLSKCATAILKSRMTAAPDSTRPAQTDEFIDLTVADDGWEVLGRLISTWEACKYCEIVSSRVLPWAQKRTPCVSDWMVEEDTSFDRRGDYEE